MKTKILIAGAGPAGTTASIFLSKYKIPHIIIDKSDFPRDKVCGDALSGKTMSILNKIDPKLHDQLLADKQNFIESWGVRFVAPNRKSINVPFLKVRTSETRTPGFISKRFNFDQYLFNLIDKNYADVHTSVEVKEIKDVQSGLSVTCQGADGSEFHIETEVIIGADGAQSVVAKQMGKLKYDDAYYSAGIRCYFENVS